MQLKAREVILLKPTPAFLAFLSGILPKSICPDLKLLQTDTTAYTLPLQTSDEALLDVLEVNFLRMFRHEIKRWLGEDEIFQEIKVSFLDFLCCFKFETHTHIVVLENAFESGQQLLRVKPRSFFLKKMQSQYFEAEAEAEGADEDEDVATLVEQMTLSHVTENATVIIKNFKTLNEVHPFLKQYFRPIFKMEMMRVCDSRAEWPAVNSFEEFSRYFLIDVHTNLVHLCI
jgi:hypothetical protein